MVRWNDFTRRISGIVQINKKGGTRFRFFWMVSNSLLYISPSQPR